MNVLELTLCKMLLFYLISWCGNFFERHSFRIVSGDSPETMRKLCLSKKFQHQVIRWNNNILHNVMIETAEILFFDLSYTLLRHQLLNPKTAWGSHSPLHHPCGFSKIVPSKQRMKLWFFVTFNIISRHIFPENFIELPQVVQKIWRNSLSIVANFHQFSSFSWIFWHYLVTKKLMTSA